MYAQLFLLYRSFSEESFESVNIMPLSTLNMDLFALRYYWCRVEFAKSRGQIHTHLFAIDDVMNVMPDVWCSRLEIDISKSGVLHSFLFQNWKEAELRKQCYLELLQL